MIIKFNSYTEIPVEFIYNRKRIIDHVYFEKDENVSVKIFNVDSKQGLADLKLPTGAIAYNVPMNNFEVI